MALRWVLFDLNGTLVDPAVLAQPLGDSAADEEIVQSAFDDAILQAMVLTLTGEHAVFADLIAAGLGAGARRQRSRSQRGRRGPRRAGGVSRARRCSVWAWGSSTGIRTPIARHPAAVLVGLDASREMLAQARATLPADRVELRAGRLEDPLRLAWAHRDLAVLVGEAPPASSPG